MVFDSSTSQATANKRPPGVKSAKASGKKKVVDENAVNEQLSKFQSMWTIKQEDLAMKERLSKMNERVHVGKQSRVKDVAVKSGVVVSCHESSVSCHDVAVKSGVMSWWCLVSRFTRV
ncbi:hypothetical protein F2Q69_00025090 [Brassica cretica]|uniref:No apical meristem-associated C-terminal domain-containing protein n=1 Tax=Brassica cretica TaxID=69181 RepID=A0A8S9Q9B0_BRACR|nr:hypothetical protein F2Q69_00025090 [Brassica cretica]